VTEKPDTTSSVGTITRIEKNTRNVVVFKGERIKIAKKLKENNSDTINTLSESENGISSSKKYNKQAELIIQMISPRNFILFLQNICFSNTHFLFICTIIYIFFIKNHY